MSRGQWIKQKLKKVLNGENAIYSSLGKLARISHMGHERVGADARKEHRS